MSRIHQINRAEFKHCTPEGDKLIAEIVGSMPTIGTNILTRKVSVR